MKYGQQLPLTRTVQRFGSTVPARLALLVVCVPWYGLSRLRVTLRSVRLLPGVIGVALGPHATPAKVEDNAGPHGGARSHLTSGLPLGVRRGRSHTAAVGRGRARTLVIGRGRAHTPAIERGGAHASMVGQGEIRALAVGQCGARAPGGRSKP